MADDARLPLLPDDSSAFYPELDDEAYAALDHDERAEAALDAEAMAEVEAGQVISHEAMKRWVYSLGTSEELPPPRAGD